ncbi:LacI family DNA-binding transcriptional regulator [Pseudactinotalea sp. Z1748]|uniref:LacI family DNA-binding transcriptional regulator n=1 Tax=Pseudactinotalea sp. Z1748 TaxID=3413027 RepID=UPI003C7E0843
MSPPPRRTRRPRQADIAKIAGVSQATVSLVLSKKDPSGVRIPDATRRQVEEVARTLGYVANPLARSLANGRSGLIGLYTFEAVFPIDHHDFYHPFLVGIESAAEGFGHDLLMFTSATSEDGTRSIYRGGVNRLQLADGCVLLGQNMDRDAIVRLRDNGYPFVMVGRRDIPGEGVTYVTADYGDATRQVVHHLAGLGHTRIAYLPTDPPTEPTADRDAGFWAAHDAAALDSQDLVLGVDKHAGPTPQQLDRLLDAGATCFVVHEGVVAVRVLEMLTNRGLDVPGDISVAALNDPPEQHDTGDGPALTCFRIPRRQMGAESVRLLIDQIVATEPVEPVVVTLPCTFDAGNTSGTVKQKGST